MIYLVYLLAVLILLVLSIAFGRGGLAHALGFVALLLAIGASFGCAIAPNSIRPEIEHVSHLTQHEPFTDHPTNYGSTMGNLVAHWDLPKHTYIELAEGIALDQRWPPSRAGTVDVYGETIGPREEFSARIGYVFTVKK